MSLNLRQRNAIGRQDHKQQGLHKYVLARLQAGASESDVIQHLVKRGIDPGQAGRVVQQAYAMLQAGVQQPREQEPERLTRRATGLPPRRLIWLVGGSLVCLTLLAASYIVWSPARNQREQIQQAAALPSEVVPGMATHTPVPDPTRTPTPASTATSTVIPMRTPTPASTATSALLPTRTPPPLPDAVVLVQGLDLRAGPGSNYPVLGQLMANTPLEIIGQVKRLNWFQVRVPDGRAGWVAGDTTLMQVNRSLDSVPASYFRPLTGLVQKHTLPAGLGELRIDNPGATDGLVVLVREAQAVIAAYVRAGEGYTITGIPDGMYTAFTSEGENWDGNAFNSNVRRKQFSEPFLFQTTPDEYSVWELNLDADTVPPDQFPHITPNVEMETP